MVMIEVTAAIADRYTPEELVEKLNLSIEDILVAFEEEIEVEFKEDGRLEDEWREFYGDTN